MIQIKKLKSLKSRTQARKCANIFHQNITEGHDEAYLNDVLTLLKDNEVVKDNYTQIKDIYNSSSSTKYDDIYYFILSQLGESPADWDFVNSSKLDKSKRIIRPHYLYLDHIRSPYNIGSIFRASESFGVEKIYLSPFSPSLTHPRTIRTSMGTIDSVESEVISIDKIKDLNLPIFALELGGTPLNQFKFPKEGICIIGSEEDGVSKEALGLAKSSLGLVSIKQYGAKGSLNVASSTAILLNKWMEYEEEQ